MRSILRRPRRRINFPIVPIILTLAVITLIIVLLTGAIGGTQYRRFSNSSFRLMPFTRTDIFTPFANGVAYIDTAAGQLKYLDENGKLIWGFNDATKDMTLYTSSDRLGVVVSKKLQMLNTDGKVIFNKSFERPINKLCVSNNLSVLLLTAADNSNTLTVLDKYGEKLDTLTEATGQKIIDFGLFSEGTSVWMLTVDTGSVTQTYRFFTYKYQPSKLITAGFEASDQMLYAPVFSQKNIYLCGTVEILQSDYTGKIIKKIPVSGYELASSGIIKSDMHMLLKRTGQEVNTSLMAVSGAGTANIEVPEGIIAAYVGQNSYFAFSQFNMYQYSPTTLKMLSYTMPVKADSVITGGNSAIIISGEQVYYLHLPK